MSEDGRLELDDSGAVIDHDLTRAGTVEMVDLTDPDATDALAPTALDTWVSRHAAPWLHRHRRPVSVLAVVVMSIFVIGGWWTSRPEPAPPAPTLVMANAPVVGADLGGPHVEDDGRLSVAYTVAVDTSVAKVEVVGLVGPGLDPLGVEAGPTTMAGGATGFLQLAARITCDDPAIAGASSTSYGIQLRRTDFEGGTSDGPVPFDTTTTALDTAVRDHCISSVAPSLLVTDVTLTPEPGSSIADLVVRVRNSSALPVAVSTERSPSAGIEVDESPGVLAPAGGEATLTTRLLVHDCRTAPGFAPLGSLPNAVPPPGRSRPGSGGITLRLGIGTSTTLASFEVPQSAGELAQTLGQGACDGAPTLSTRLLDVRGALAIDGTWTITGTIEIRTSGVGITLGREHFTGPPAGQGSSLATTDSQMPGVHWALAPTQLDGGAGRLPLFFSGTTCADAVEAMPGTLAVRVTTADRSTFPFEVPLDARALRGAAREVCAPQKVQIDRGTGTVIATASHTT